MRDKSRFALFHYLLAFAALVWGCALGLMLAVTVNTMNTENFEELVPALPTRLLDINGELITELSSEEKREIIKFQDLPRHLIDAIIIREDRIFYKHHGFSLKAIARAAFGVLTKTGRGGGSTLTQQIAGTLYADRRDASYKRKLRELWWAIQMERRYSKDEILEIYLNRIYFGAGTYGVSAASKYYFGHAVEELTPAESAILVVQLSNPAYYNPFDYPNRAMDRQKFVLDEMVNAGYLSRDEADASFDDFWANFDYTRINSASWFLANDKAPWFSEYVRRELQSLIYGAQDIYSSGFTVNTTLNLKHQAAAKDSMDYYLAYANSRYQASSRSNLGEATTFWTPIAELLTLVFDMPSVKFSLERTDSQVVSTYMDRVNPVLDVVAMLSGVDVLKTDFISRANAKIVEDAESNKVEGTLVSIENDTGAITALIGGSEYSASNQFIRAMQARVQPGSTFKPLYYSAALDARVITAVTPLDDSPQVFYNAAGIPYIPENYGGLWRGQVQTWYALALSLNIPALEVLDMIGFDAAIERSVSLLGISREELPSRGFDRVYPLGLGICSVRPVEMARAFAIFANGGRAVTPYGIRTIEDRNGAVVLNVEHNNRLAVNALGSAAQVISPQNAFIMTSLLQAGARMGTLSASAQNGRIFTYKTPAGEAYTLPVSGKTGTTQNWSDAWVVGSSPYLTAAVWFGFDRKGRTLGRDLTGAQLSGGAWARFMLPANEDYPSKGFPASPGGLVFAEVCSVSGGLLTPECGGYRTSQWFLAGTAPTEPCTLHANLITTRAIMADRLEREYLSSGVGLQQLAAGSLVLDLSFLYPPSLETPGGEEAFFPTEGILPEGLEGDVIIPQLDEQPVLMEEKVEELEDADYSGDEPLPRDVEENDGYPRDFISAF